MTAAVATPKIRLSALLAWLPVIVPVVGLIVVGLPAIAAGDIPDSAYMFTDPLVLPALAITSVVMIMLPGVFSRMPAQPPADAPPPRRRLALRAAAAAVIVLACLGLRVVVIRSAVPTRQAIDLMRRNAVAGAKIGAPVEVGWDVRGWIHADAEVNDEHVPPSIDASVPVHGPRGSGVLSIDGRLLNGRWAFDRVALRLDRGERIDIVSGRVARQPGWEMDPTTMAFIGGGLALTALLLGSILLMLRSSDPARAVASVEPTPGAPFSLRFTPAAPGKFTLWLRFELEWQEGGEDDYGVTAQVEARVAGAIASAIELRIGDKAPAIGAQGERNTTLYRVTSVSSGDGNTRRATAKLGEVQAAAGSEVVVTGKAVVAEGCTTSGLLVFAVPA